MRCHRSRWRRYAKATGAAKAWVSSAPTGQSLHCTSLPHSRYHTQIGRTKPYRYDSPRPLTPIPIKQNCNGSRIINHRAAYVFRTYRLDSIISFLDLTFLGPQPTRLLGPRVVKRAELVAKLGFVC